MIKKIILVILSSVLILSVLSSCAEFSEGSEYEYESEGDSLDSQKIEALRGTVVYETEHFSINGMMMQYLLNAEYQEFYKTCSKTAETLGIKTNHYVKTYLGLDVQKPLQDQIFHVTEPVDGIDPAYLGFEGSWFDMFWTAASDRAKLTLAYCEVAKEKGIGLTQSDRDAIDNAVKRFKNDTPRYVNGIYSTIQGSSEAVILKPSTVVGEEDSFGIVGGIPSGSIGDESYIFSENNIFRPVSSEGVFIIDGSNILNPGSAGVFRTGVSEEDVRDAMELRYLAKKCRATLSSEGFESVLDDDAMIERYFNNGINRYYRADYLSLSIPYEGGLLEDVLETANTLVECKTEDEFMKRAIAILFDAEWKDVYNGVIEDLKKNGFHNDEESKLIDDDIPNEDLINEQKDKILENVSQGILKGLEADALESYDPDIEDYLLFGKAMRTVRDEMYVLISEKCAEITVRHGKWDESSDVDNWIFSSDRAEWDSKFFAPDVWKEGAAVEVRTVLRPRYIDETPAVSFGQILISFEDFKSEKEAENKANEIFAQIVQGGLSDGTFETHAANNTADDGIFYSNVTPDDISSPVNDWLFSSSRCVGDIEILKSEMGYHIVYLTEITDEPSWRVAVIKDIVKEQMDGTEAEIKAAYDVEYCGDSIKESMSIVTSNVMNIYGADSIPKFEYTVIVPSEENKSPKE